MQAAHERRSNVAVRVPLDVLVSLAHRDYDEPFEADAVNLSTGGLSMRAAYLPEVGSRLACRFECPPLGAPLEAEGEVVWAADVGEHMGEFGVRFIALDARSEDAIRALVGDEPESDGVPVPGSRPVARLFLDGVPTPIVARVTHRADDLVTVEQDLPFLALDTGVAVRDPSGASRRGRIGSVDLQLCGDVPKLVLQVVFDEPAATIDVRASRPATLPGDDRTDPDLVAPTMMARAAYADDEAEHAAIRRSSAGAIAAASDDEDDADDASDDDDDVADELDAPEFATAKAARAQSVDAYAATQAVATAKPSARERESARVVRSERGDETNGTRASATVVNQTLAVVMAKLLPLIARSRAELIAFWERAKPAMLAAFERARVAVVALAHRAGPSAQRALARSAAFVARFTTILRAKLGERAASRAALAQKPRRTTAPAPAAAAPSEWRSRKAAEAAPEPVAAKRPIGRYVVLATAAVGALALCVYAFSGGDDDETLTVPVAPSAPAAPTPIEAPAPAAALEAPIAQPAPLAPVVAVDPPTPTALSAPSYVAGHLPPPTYPTLQAAARPTAPPTALGTASPYAVDVRGESVAGHDPTLRAPAAITVGAPTAAPTPAAVPSSTREFGQPSVARGQTFTLRMSQTVVGITGRRDANGFDVRIDGALTLDRAAPIAATHSAVATAMIINRGDHADLAIRFREGMAPAYRVVARGATLEITIARR